MANMSDTIEQFIISLFEEQEPTIEFKRNELAHYFGCAPSQINYVLSTRFTVDRGYLITSRRGGSGSINIERLSAGENELFNIVTKEIGDKLSYQKAAAVLKRILEYGLITEREYAIMQTAVQNVPMVNPSLYDYIRAVTLKNMLVALINREQTPG